MIKNIKKYISNKIKNIKNFLIAKRNRPIKFSESFKSNVIYTENTKDGIVMLLEYPPCRRVVFDSYGQHFIHFPYVYFWCFGWKCQFDKNKFSYKLGTLKAMFSTEKIGSPNSYVGFIPLSNIFEDNFQVCLGCIDSIIESTPMLMAEKTVKCFWETSFQMDFNSIEWSNIEDAEVAKIYLKSYIEANHRDTISQITGIGEDEQFVEYRQPEPKTRSKRKGRSRINRRKRRKSISR